MTLDPDALAASLETGIRSAQQGLFEHHRMPAVDVGQSLHLAAFAAVCLQIHLACEYEVGVDDLRPRVERALRRLCAAHDARPDVPGRRSLLHVFRRLGGEGTLDVSVRDSRSVSIAVPGVPDAAPGERTAYTIGRFRHYLQAVFLYSADAHDPNTWSAAGGPFALERALFADIYAEPVAPGPDRDVFAHVLTTFQGARPSGSPAPRRAARG